MKIYTRTGDRGRTGLLAKGRVRKDAKRLVAIGSLDETSAAIGAAIAFLRDASLGASLARLQEDLLELGAHLAVPPGGTRAPAPPGPRRILAMEREIDRMEAGLPALRNFILPGGSPAGSLLHQARAIARRAEREIVSLGGKEPVSPAVLVYVNRLSDFLFVAARHANRKARARERIWKGSGKT